MKPLFCLTILMFPLGAFSEAQTRTALVIANSESLEAKVNVYLKPYLDGHLFSGAVLMAKGDKILLRKGYGMANYELGVANTPDTKFRIASVTKSFTAAAIVMLNERGLLDLSDKLNKFIPDYPNGDKITVLHLLRHESGVPNPDYTELFFKRITIEELIEQFKHKPLEFEPGTNSKYSNAGYVLLAYIVQEVSGMPWEEFLYKNIFKPLGMESTGNVQHEQIITNQAAGYLPGPGAFGVENAPWYDMSSSIGGGSLYTSANDLYRWVRAVHTERLFKISALKYPYGWGKRKYFDRAGLEQSGLITGFTSNIQIYFDDSLYVICLTNIETTGFNKWSKDIAGIAFGKGYEAATFPQRKGSEPKLWEPFLGQYKSTSGMTVCVFQDKGNLYITLNDFPVRKYVRPVSDSEFFMPSELSAIRFFKGADGKISRLTWSSDNDSGTEFTKLDSPSTQ